MRGYAARGAPRHSILSNAGVVHQDVNDAVACSPPMYILLAGTLQYAYRKVLKFGGIGKQ